MVKNETMKVSHSRSPTTCATGMLCSKEKPKSPCNIPPSQVRYCMYQGWSSP